MWESLGRACLGHLLLSSLGLGNPLFCSSMGQTTLQAQGGLGPRVNPINGEKPHPDVSLFSHFLS